MYRISIDPGVNYGWALWSDEEWDSLVLPKSCGVVECAGGDISATANSIVHMTDRKFGHLAISHCYIEYPMFFDTEGGVKVAKRGDLIKLACTVGLISSLLRHKCGAEIVMLPVPKWKGQMKKEIVIAKIRHKLPDIDTVSPASHAWDAIGIGLYAKGYLGERR